MCDCKIFLSHWHQRSLIAFTCVMDFFQRKRNKIISFFVGIDMEKGWTCLFINCHWVSWKFNFWWMVFGKWKDIRMLQRKLIKVWFMKKKIFLGYIKMFVLAKPTWFCSQIAIIHWINTHLCRKLFVKIKATRINRKILIIGGVNLQEAVSTFKINWFWECFQLLGVWKSMKTSWKSTKIYFSKCNAFHANVNYLHYCHI